MPSCVKRLALTLSVFCLTLGCSPKNSLPTPQEIATIQENMRYMGIALEAYYVDTNTYPDHLEQLVPEYLSHLPSDPFSAEPNKPYQYQKNPKFGDSWIIYLDGPDGKTDISPVQDYFDFVSTDNPRKQLAAKGYDPATGKGDLFRVKTDDLGLDNY